MTLLHPLDGNHFIYLNVGTGRGTGDVEHLGFDCSYLCTHPKKQSSYQQVNSGFLSLLLQCHMVGSRRGF